MGKFKYGKVIKVHQLDFHYYPSFIYEPFSPLWLIGRHFVLSKYVDQAKASIH